MYCLDPFDRDVQQTDYEGNAIITRCGRVSPFKHILFDPEKLAYAGKIKFDRRWKCPFSGYFITLRAKISLVGCVSGYLDLYDIIEPIFEDAAILTHKLRFLKQIKVNDKLSNLKTVIVTNNEDIIAISEYTDLIRFRTYVDISMYEKHRNYTGMLFRLPLKLGLSDRPHWDEAHKRILIYKKNRLFEIDMGRRSNTCIGYMETVIHWYYPVVRLNDSNLVGFVVRGARLSEVNILQKHTTWTPLRRNAYDKWKTGYTVPLGSH